MGIKKWLMKQQWRIVQIRGIWGLFYGILLLAIAYFEYIQFFADMGSLGPFAFAAVILIVFLILGYLYDRVLVLWAPSQEVSIERNPYQYVPSPKDHVFWFPIYSALLEASHSIAREFDIDTEMIEETKRYYAQFQSLKPERKGDIDKGIELRQDYVSKHLFKDILKDDEE